MLNWGGIETHATSPEVPRSAAPTLVWCLSRLALLSFSVTKITLDQSTEIIRDVAGVAQQGTEDLCSRHAASGGLGMPRRRSAQKRHSVPRQDAILNPKLKRVKSQLGADCGCHRGPSESPATRRRSLDTVWSSDPRPLWSLPDVAYKGQSCVLCDVPL